MNRKPTSSVEDRTVTVLMWGLILSVPLSVAAIAALIGVI
jgi:hypothetical protein